MNTKYFPRIVLLISITMYLPSGVIAQGMGMMWDRESMQNGMMLDRLPPGIVPESLPEFGSAGATLMQRYCTQCHTLPSPRMNSAQEWPAVYQRMSSRMKMMSRRGMMCGKWCDNMSIQAPNAAEGKELLAYLQRHGLRTPKEMIEGLDSPDGLLFSQTCSQCHALPDPRQHTPEGWPGVIKRMKQYMSSMDKSVITSKEEIKILQFLQQAISQ